MMSMEVEGEPLESKGVPMEFQILYMGGDRAHYQGGPENIRGPHTLHGVPRSHIFPP